MTYDNDLIPWYLDTGRLVEVVEDQNRQKALMYKMHSGALVMEELTAKGIAGHIGINKTVSE